MPGENRTQEKEAPAKGRRGLKALQQELVDVKDKYKENLKVMLSKNKQKEKSGPWPITVQATFLPTKDAETFDVSSLIIKFLILKKFDPSNQDHLPVQVQMAENSELPKVLCEKIAATVEQQWRTDLIAKGSSQGWLLSSILEWTQRSYLKLIRLMPELIEFYLGCDSEGCSQRRFTILKPSEVPNEETSSDESITAEEAEKAALYYAQKELEKRQKEEEAERKKKAEGAKIRAMYEEGKLHAAPPQLSKKEEAERRKKKQGVRTAKTAPRAKPYDGEGAKERRKGKTKA